MKGECRPHLWIPEEEVTFVRKKITGRGHDYGLDCALHGERLTEGLRSVREYCRTLSDDDSLAGENLITFRIVLQEKEDVSNTRRLIEGEGLTINAVTDRTHAVVSGTFEAFDSLQRKVERYREKGRRKDFQLISSFLPFGIEDKKSSSLSKNQSFDSEKPVAVQIKIMPGLEKELYERVLNRVMEKIEKQLSYMPSCLRLTNGRAIISAEMRSSELDEIASDSGVYRIQPTTLYGNVLPSFIIPLAEELRLDPEVDISSLPAVVVLDDGVDLPDPLNAAVPVHWVAGEVRRNDYSGYHGTAVASRVLFENLGMHIGDTVLSPRVRVIDAMIYDGEITEEDLIRRVTEAVRAFSSVSSVFNLSYNSSGPVSGVEMSALGAELDALSLEYGVKFVVSAGNHNLVMCKNSLREIVEDDESRIAAPADALFAVTVGAVAGCSYHECISRENEIAPYSRRGPGFNGFCKPDIVAYGANVLKNGKIPLDPFAVSLCHGGAISQPGTSFTSPVVAGDLAQVMRALPEDDVFMAEALLYNRAHPLYDMAASTKDEIALSAMLYGRGLSSPEDCMYSSDDRVSFLHSGSMNRLTKQRVRFLIPSVVTESQNGKKRNGIKVTVTCTSRPPVDNERNEEYTSAYISVSIHRLNSKGKMVADNPSVSDRRDKWDVCQHFSKRFTSFSPGDWEVWLELFTRWGVEDDKEIPYSLVITVEDLSCSGRLYRETVREAGDRFTSREKVRVSVL